MAEKTYPPEQIDAKLKEMGLEGWYLEEGWLRKKFNTDGWPTTLMLVNAVGYVCEAAGHHADLAVTYGDDDGYTFEVMLGDGNGTFTFAPKLSFVKDPNAHCAT